MNPNLLHYDWILVNSSAGKDSQAMLTSIVETCDSLGISRDRIVVVHADLGAAEWQGTKELARAQAEAYGLRFEVVSRIGGVAKRTSATYTQGEVYGDILDYARHRGSWPSSTARWCTSEFKRGPVRALWTRLADEARARGVSRPRILNCMGLRAQESPARAKREAFSVEVKGSSSRRQVDEWLPIHEWTTDEVWSVIRASGLPHHRAYDLGMPRLSCAFCIFAPRAALVLAGRHNRALLDEYVAVEREIGHKWTARLSLAEVAADVDAGVEGEPLDDGGCWNM